MMIKSIHTTTIRACTGWIFLLMMQGRYLYWSVLAATTKYHRLRDSHKRNFFSSEAWEIRDQGAGKVGFILSPILLASGGHHLALCSHGLSLVHVQRKRE